MAQLTRSEAARKITQLFALERLALGEIAVAHPILAALQQVCTSCYETCTGWTKLHLWQSMAVLLLLLAPSGTLTS